MSDDEAERIGFSAQIRCLTTAEYIRRAALGRQTKVRIENELVLSICAVTKSIRGMYSIFLNQKIQVPVDELCEVIRQGTAAILRIAD